MDKAIIEVLSLMVVGSHSESPRPEKDMFPQIGWTDGHCESVSGTKSSSKAPRKPRKMKFLSWSQAKFGSESERYHLQLQQVVTSRAKAAKAGQSSQGLR